MISLSLSSCLICSPLLLGVFIPCCLTSFRSFSSSLSPLSCFFFFNSAAYLPRKSFSSSVSSTMLVIILSLYLPSSVNLHKEQFKGQLVQVCNVACRIIFPPSISVKRVGKEQILGTK